MNWSPQQDRARSIVSRWIRDPHAQQVMSLAGYAGTGKTTIAKELVSNAGTWLFAAFTGKAAHVLQTKGCTGARTIHSLIYKPAGEKNQEQILQLEAKLLRASPAERPAIIQQLAALRRARQPRWALWNEGPLSDPDVAGVVIDEVSMVNSQLGRDLESFDKKILVLGDPAQLPPVMGGGYFTDREPDVMLTEIHRHARDRGVLRLATHIREGRSLSSFASAPDAQILSAATTDPADRAARALAADQVLVGLNATRHASNRRMRALRERTHSLPYAGDRVVCLRNDRDLGIFNGSQWTVVNSVSADNDTATFSVRSEDDDRTVTSEAWLHHFQGRGDELTAMGQGQRDAAVYDWGYALTVHKAQGSQYKRVLVIDESRKLGGCEPRQWLYTAITRSIDHVEVLT